MSVQKTIQQKVIVSGKGETKQHAFASALAEIQNKIMEQSNVLLRIEPVNVDILKAVENKYTERFLFFFFPRQCISYEVELLCYCGCNRNKIGRHIVQPAND